MKKIELNEFLENPPKRAVKRTRLLPNARKEQLIDAAIAIATGVQCVDYMTPGLHRKVAGVCGVSVATAFNYFKRAGGFQNSVLVEALASPDLETSREIIRQAQGHHDDRLYTLAKRIGISPDLLDQPIAA